MSLKGHLNQTDVIQSVRLEFRHPSTRNKIWILVEGDSDIKLYLKLINGKDVSLQPAHGGVLNLLNAVKTLSKEIKDRVIGIRDADFIRLEGNIQIPENIFLTDYHDMEMMLISCDNAFTAVAIDYLNEKENHLALRQNILESIAFIGGVRLINHCCQRGLNFKKFGIGDFYDCKESISLDECKYLDALMKRSENKTREVKIEEIQKETESISDLLNLCNGHDFQKVFALYVNSKTKEKENRKKIARSFRLAYSFQDFKNTELYAQLKEWAGKKSKVLFETHEQV